ncbi:MAG: diphosphomevalonate decarboxylase [Woeseiaceae bacterium]
MRAIARAQPNIAVIKYWGKRDLARNLPAVGSISVTLADLFTEMSVVVDDSLADDVLVVNDTENRTMLARVSACLDAVAGDDRPAARICSTSNFPIAAGLASSASAFAALVIAADAAFDSSLTDDQLARLAGRASGSAARSMLGGFVELENRDDDIVVNNLLAAEDWPLKVVVAITAPGPKPVSSGDAMEISRKTSPFYDRWVEQQAVDLSEARAAILERDLQRLGSIAEHNCLKMHSVMWGSRPPMIYWNSATIACMQTVRELQAEGVEVFFTIDAGPQLKAICSAEYAAKVRDSLAATDGVVEVMLSGLGGGARLVDAC